MRGARPLLALSVALAALLATEGLLRLPALRTPSPFAETPRGTLVPSQAWSALAPFEVTRAPTRPRIVWMGESTVAGFPYNPKMSPPAWLDFILSRRGAQVEVVPLAGPGLDSSDLAALLPHALSLRPAVILLTTGHNEYLESGLLLDRPWWRHFQLAWRVRAWLGRAALSTERLPTPEDDFDHAAILARFRDNLDAMQAACDAAGVPLVLCTAVCNLSDFPPLLGDDPRLPEDADQAWARGRALLQAGDVPAARLAFEAARDRDRWPHRATARFLEAIAAHPLRIDVAAAFDAASHSGVPGFDLLVDHCHPDPGGQRLMARAVADALEDLKLIPATGQSGQAPELAEGLARFGIDEAALAAMRAVLARGYVGFALITGRWGAYAEFALQNLEPSLAALSEPGEMDTSFALLELLRGDVEAARARLEHAAATTPERLDLLQRACERYPWVRGAFERNGVKLEARRLVPLGS